jgi:tight adherence protein C
MNLLLVTIGITLLLGFFLVFLLVGRRSWQSLLLAELTRQDSEADAESQRKGWPARLSPERLARPIARFRSLFGGGTDPEVVRRLMLAGYRKAFHADLFIGAKLLLPALVGLAVAFLLKESVFLWFILSVVTAFFVPDFWINHAIQARRLRIKLSLPDAVDLLAICMEAGLGLDQAIVRIGHEMKLSHPDLSDEFLQINLEQRAGSPRITTLRNMADRVGVESVRSFVNMLVQTERFGTPVSKSLSAFSDTMRTQRRQQVEERAAKTTIKLVLPLVFFIFPSIFIVTVGPAVITLIKTMGSII